jgi:hypothetical protein
VVFIVCFVYLRSILWIFVAMTSTQKQRSLVLDSFFVKSWELSTKSIYRAQDLEWAMKYKFHTIWMISSIYRSYENCRRPGVAILDMQMSKVPIISGYAGPY